MQAMQTEDLTLRLVKLAGDAVYAQGLGCFDAGNVRDLEVADQQARANVVYVTAAGSSDYRVTLRETPRRLEGSCECPASDGFDFCEHCVAVALAVADHQQRAVKLSAGDADERIAAYLNDQGSDQLRALLLELQADDARLHQQLLQRADVAQGHTSLRSLKKTITAAIPQRQLHQTEQVHRFFERVEIALAGIETVAANLEAQQILELVDHTIARLRGVLPRIADPSRQCERCFAMLRQLYALGLARDDWSVQQRAEHILRYQLADTIELFANAVQDFGAQLGADGVDAYYQGVQQRFETMSADAGQSYSLLARVLEERARSLGDAQALLKIAMRNAHSPRDCLRVARLCLELEDYAGALHWLDRAEADSGVTESGSRLRVLLHQTRADWTSAATAQLVLLDLAPSVDNVRMLLHFAAQAGRSTNYEEQARTLLQTKVANPMALRESAALSLAWLLQNAGEQGSACDVLLAQVHDEHYLLEALPWFDLAPPHLATAIVDKAVEGFIAHKTSAAYNQAVTTLAQAKWRYQRISPRAFGQAVLALQERHLAKHRLVRQLLSLGVQP